jgi:putative phosphoribosyl transferase
VRNDPLRTVRLALPLPRRERHAHAMDEFLHEPSAFADRRQAGRLLADAVSALPGLRAPIVLALPRGGVPVGFEVARSLDAPLDVLIVRKLGMPGQEELALGAVASGGTEVLNRDLVDEARVPSWVIERVREHEVAEVERRDRRYRDGRPWPALQDRSVIVVDDGAATGASMLVALSALRPQRPAELVVGLPVAARDVCGRLRTAAERVVCLRAPEFLLAIGAWYLDFAQVSDDEVDDLLARAAHPPRLIRADV